MQDVSFGTCASWLQTCIPPKERLQMGQGSCPWMPNAVSLRCRTWAILSSWTSVLTCRRAVVILSCMVSMPCLCIQDTAAMQGITTAMSRWVLYLLALSKELRWLWGCMGRANLHSRQWGNNFLLLQGYFWYVGLHECPCNTQLCLNVVGHIPFPADVSSFTLHFNPSMFRGLNYKSKWLLQNMQLLKLLSQCSKLRVDLEVAVGRW